MKRFLALFVMLFVFLVLGVGAGTVLSATPVSAQSSSQVQSSAASRPIYAALGDSVAAGNGLAPKATPKGNDTFCKRSAQAYPFTVAKSAGLPVLHIACSGATAGDLFTKQGITGPNIRAQLSAVYAAGNPRLITITAGANDAHWRDFANRCDTTACDTQATTALANTYLLALRVKLHIALTEIAARSDGTPPIVIITGYYNPLSPACAQFQTNVTPAEITWFTNETNALNQAIQNVSSHYSFVRFAPVDFTGHDICSTNSWVQGLSDPAPFHPTVAGQKAIAASVISELAQ